MNKLKTVIKYFIICLTAIVFYACPPKCEPQLIMISPIPDSILNIVPYANEDVMSLKHSGGAIINFSCVRLKRNGFMECFRSCCTTIEYEIDETLLKPDYPLPDISITLSRKGEEYVDMYLGFSGSWFSFWLYDNDVFTLPDFEMDGTVYHNVWALKAQKNDSYTNKNELFADSLYYSNEFGILKIKMSNGETFNHHKATAN